MILPVVGVSLAALLQAKPDGQFWAREWLDVMLARYWPGYSERGDVSRTGRSWSVGAVVGTETLVQSRPIVRDRNGRLLDDLLRTSAPCVLAAYAEQGRGRRSSPTVSRFQRWIGVMSEPELVGDSSTAMETLRDGLRGDLSSFLATAERLGSDRELVFSSFLSALQRLGGLGSTYATAMQIHRALIEVYERVPTACSLNLFVTDGRTLGVLHRGGTLLAVEPPPPPEQARRSVRRVDGTADPLANLFIFAREEPQGPPEGGGERIGEGVFTTLAARPREITREP